MRHDTATVVHIQRFSTEDGPGIRTTVFFKGCPMRCPWCHNPETMRFEPELVWNLGRCLGDAGCVERCPEKALSAKGQGIGIDRSSCRACRTCVEYCPSEALEMHGRTLSASALFDILRRDVSFYEASGGGVTLSGGEPLAQPEASVALLRLLKNAGIHTAVDTCGAVSERALNDALECTDLVLFDVKTVDTPKHESFTGIPFHRIAASAKVVETSGVPVWIRTPVIPGYTDGEEAIRAVARFVRNTFSNCRRYDLLAFSNLCEAKYKQLGRAFALAQVPPLSAEHMERLCAIAREERLAEVHWSGPTRLECLSDSSDLSDPSDSLEAPA